ncbi:glucose dehydrogenase [FAD, quinone]-like [Aricia agestis]|uniref:glucose dehydrogenase [FAD, quinone]-like n=1 Tax=Aricia agestis TaxID=91739 RepID=UPI001C208087|nr:glucose dehydrogenase [FAD, quinone]-like [Aricia agestis]XP_041988503.1 glucose dehydrogenase [FAD, quinone]-like [Aricia agestis]
MIWDVWSFFLVKVLGPITAVLQIAAVLITSTLFKHDFYPENTAITDNQVFDFVIIGGGTAGCVIANRLTEVGNWSVLLVEAGDDPPFLSESPGLSLLSMPALPEWELYTEDDKFSSQAQKTNSIRMYQGKMLGGSSSLNYMFYVRGNKADYDGWADRGNDDWGWDAVLEYFKKSERMNDEHIWKTDSASLHNKHGYLGVSKSHWNETDEYLRGFELAGHEAIYDINGHRQLGFGIPFFTVDDSVRQSTAHSFLRPIKNRQNLYLAKNTRANKIIFDEDNRAVGVELASSNGDRKVARVEKEVVLSAGALHSPQLLMLSGIGPRRDLESIGIKPVVDSPKVGSNLMDHMIVPVISKSERDLNSLIKNLDVFTRTDHINLPSILGFVALDKSQTYPDYQVSAFPMPAGSPVPTLFSGQVFGYNDAICQNIARSGTHEQLYSLITYLHPESRGRITLRSADISDAPLVNVAYFSDERDLDKFARSVADYVSVFNTTFFRSIGSEVVYLERDKCKDHVPGSLDYWKCYVLNMAASQFHVSGTCAMGPRDDDVVDKHLKVRGVRGLRVADASVMPTLVSGNINAAVIMIGEKAADMIKMDHTEC